MSNSLSPYRKPEIVSPTICANCKFVSSPKDPDRINASVWLCRSGAEIKSLAHQDPVTGKFVETEYHWSLCEEKNKDAQCPEYQEKEIVKLSIWRSIFVKVRWMVRNLLPY